MAVRRVTLSSLAVVLVVAAALIVTFWVALEPVQIEGCHTRLAESTFKSALIPVHVAAMAVLAVFAWLISARRRGRALPGHPTLGALAAGWLYVAASLADHDLFGLLGLVAVVAAPTVGLLGVVALLVRTLVALRGGADWGDHAFSVQVLLWGALVIGLPANLAYAWSSGADFFCF
jgi:hypothetical protein